MYFVLRVPKFKACDFRWEQLRSSSFKPLNYIGNCPCQISGPGVRSTCRDLRVDHSRMSIQTKKKKKHTHTKKNKNTHTHKQTNKQKTTTNKFLDNDKSRSLLKVLRMYVFLWCVERVFLTKACTLIRMIIYFLEKNLSVVSQYLTH